VLNTEGRTDSQAARAAHFSFRHKLGTKQKALHNLLATQGSIFAGAEEGTLSAQVAAEQQARALALLGPSPFSQKPKNTAPRLRADFDSRHKRHKPGRRNSKKRLSETLYTFASPLTSVAPMSTESCPAEFLGRIFHRNTAALNSLRIVRRFSTMTRSHDDFVSIGK
jgi:hypothetical protein